MNSKKVRVPIELKTKGLGEMALPEEASNYLSRVHRLAPGDIFCAFDPEHALEADAQLLRADSRSKISARILEIRPARILCQRSITLLQAMSKGDKMDAVVRDATELGLTCFIPVIAERSVSRPSDTEAAQIRRDRLERIAVQAARQSGRGDIPRIHAPMPLEQALLQIAPVSTIANKAQSIAPLAFCLDPHASKPLREGLLTLSHTTPIVLAVGPEGGFSESELLQFERAGFERARLGSLILRTETVCAAVLGALLVLSPSAPNPSEAPW